MAKRGSITVFLALILSLLLSLVCASLESVRMAASRTQILNGMDIGLYSLFGQYDKTMLKDYDLFVLNGAKGTGALDMADVYDRLTAYVKPVLKQNGRKLSITQGGFTGYRLLTDDNGEVFYQQIVQYMRETLGSHGIQLLLDRMQERQRKTEEAENAGNQAESQDSLGSYDVEIDNAAKNSQEAQAEKDKNESQNPAGDGFGDGGGGPSVPTAPVENPIPVIQRIRKMGLLELVLPAGRGVSENQVARAALLSGRTLQQGMPMYGAAAKEDSYTANLLFQQYLIERLGNYVVPASTGLRYQTEYVICGKTSDLDNLRAIAGKLLLIREGINLAHLVSDPGKMSQASALAAAIAGTFLIPPAAVVIQGALLLCWSFAESILDVRELFDGGRVPMVKSAGDWQLSLQNLPHLLDGLDSQRRGNDKGLSYEDYLQIFLLMQGKNNKILRTMDMVEYAIRTKGQKQGFRLDSCIVALEASMDVRAEKKKTFTVIRQYCYE